jgi:hypothetical protein
MKSAYGRVPVLGQKILQAPRAARFVDLRLVPAADQLRGNTPEEMRVSVIPI